jgi:outer membrane protein assembly factor BamE
MFLSRSLVATGFCLLLAACSYKPAFVSEYKIDIQQGNVLSQEMVSQLRPGLTRDQVRYVLGTPLIADIFHQQRWDYVYRYRNGQTEQVETRKLTLFFDDDHRLARVEGDVDLAVASELAAPVARNRVVDLGSISPEAAGKPLPPREEPGFVRRLMNMIGF